MFCQFYSHSTRSKKRKLNCLPREKVKKRRDEDEDADREDILLLVVQSLLENQQQQQHNVENDNNAYDRLLLDISSANDISMLLPGGSLLRQTLMMNDDRLTGERSIIALQNAMRDRLQYLQNEIEHNSILMDIEYDRILIAINYATLEELVDGGLYEQMISDIQNQYLTGDRNVNLLTEKRIDRYNELLKTQEFNRIKKGMEDETDILNLSDGGMWNREILNSIILNTGDRRELERLRDSLFKNAQDEDEIERGINNETRLESMFSTGHWGLRISESDLNENAKRRLNDLRLRRMNELIDQEVGDLSLRKRSEVEIKKYISEKEQNSKFKDENEIEKGIDDETNLDSLLNTGHWSLRISESGLSKDVKRRLDDLRLKQMSGLIDQEVDNLLPKEAKLEDSIDRRRLPKNPDYKDLKRHPFIMGKKEHKSLEYGGRTLWNPMSIIKPSGEIFDPIVNVDMIIVEYKKSLADPLSVSDENVEKIRKRLIDYMTKLENDDQRVEFLTKVTKILINRELNDTSDDNDLNDLFDAFDFSY